MLRYQLEQVAVICKIDDLVIYPRIGGKESGIISIALIGKDTGFSDQRYEDAG